MRFVVALLLVPMLAGCLTVFDEEEHPESGPLPTVSGTRIWDRTFQGFDNTSLAGIVYEPLSTDAVDGEAPSWPVVVFVHGWGFAKEQWLHAPMGDERVDFLQMFADAGFLAVAYDARGFGRSEGSVTVAGVAELKDLEMIIDQVQADYRTTGKVGVTGTSYGGAHAYMALTQLDVTTAVPHYGWVDLVEGVIPGDVPKVEWAQALYAVGTAGSGGKLHPMVTEWYESMYTRAQDPDSFEQAKATIATRNTLPDLPATAKPLFICQGMQESLFPQSDLAWDAAGGFVRSHIYTGGHSTFDEACWGKTLDWFRAFLQDQNVGVEDWPALVTDDARGGRHVEYDRIPATTVRSFGLRAPDLTDAAYSNATFTIQQRGVGNPFTEPSVIGDLTGSPPSALPSQFTQDPQAVFFTSAPVEEANVLIGAPTLSLVLAQNATPPYQVVGTLFVEADGRSQPLTRAAHAVLDEHNGTLDLRFHWVKADIDAGDKLVLKLGANDPSWWMPLFANYSVTFTGESRLDVPLLA